MITSLISEGISIPAISSFGWSKKTNGFKADLARSIMPMPR